MGETVSKDPSVRSRLRPLGDPLVLLAGLFDASPAASMILHADGSPVLVNQAFRTLFGGEPDSERSIFDAGEGLTPVMLAVDVDAVRRALAGETAAAPPIWYDTPAIAGKAARRLAMATRYLPLRDTRGAISHVAVRYADVTAELELGAERDRMRGLELQLAQAQRLEAIGRLAGGIAHDFNNLLSVVLTFTELAAEDEGVPVEVRADLDQVRRAGERAADLTRQLLAFSRRQMLQPRATSLVDAVAELERMLRRLIGEDIELVARHAPDLPTVRVDPGQLEQVILNLVLNARDAMPSGGHITIETSEVVLDAAYAARHVGVTPGRYVLMAVSDDGVGMDRETQGHVFEPFFTTKRQGEGTGLGLATVYGVVKQSGGNIWVYSEPGLGTTFKVYLPRSDADAPAIAVEPPAVATGRGELVLIVEDDHQVREVAERILTGSGYRVLVAGGAAQAELIAASHPGTIALLLTDVVMPQVSGRELAELLCARTPALRVLYMSGYTEDAIVRHGVLDHALHFVEKPLTPAALLRKVRHVLDL